jgi:KipI family sensor histidine kinase inhibitor
MNSLSQADLALPAELIFSNSGLSAVLVNLVGLKFEPSVQRKLWALAATLEKFDGLGVKEVVPGVNNLLVVFDPVKLHPSDAQQLIAEWWGRVDASTVQGREVEIPVIYGGAAGEDLSWLAKAAGLDIEGWVKLHSEATYMVACVGSMPGFAYMTGLPRDLAIPRRSTPRMSVSKGTVIIGGAQAGVMPCTAPSGWHSVGVTDADMFNPHRDMPCLLSPGDYIRFINKGIEG